MRSSGSPPVTRSLSTPRPVNTPASRSISSKVSRSCFRQPGVLRLGHAVLTPQVAAVGHRQAEVAQRALQGVEEHTRAGYLNYGMRPQQGGAGPFGYDVGPLGMPPVTRLRSVDVFRGADDGRDGHRQQPGRLEHRLRAAAARRVARMDADRPRSSRGFSSSMGVSMALAGPERAPVAGRRPPRGDDRRTRAVPVRLSVLQPGTLADPRRAGADRRSAISRRRRLGAAWHGAGDTAGTVRRLAVASAVILAGLLGTPDAGAAARWRRRRSDRRAGDLGAWLDRTLSAAICGNRTGIRRAC